MLRPSTLKTNPFQSQGKFIDMLEQVRDFPILSGFPNHANSASPLLIVRWGEDHGTSLQPGFA